MPKDKFLPYINIFCFFFTFINIIFYFVGYDYLGVNPHIDYYDALVILSFCFSAYTGPTIIQDLFFKYKQEYYWFFDSSTIDIFFLIFISLCIFLNTNNYIIDISFLIVLGSLVLGYKFFKQSLKTPLVWTSMVLGSIIGLLMTAYLFSWGKWQSPFLTEQFALMHTDALFHPTIVHLFNTYKFSTTGLNSAIYLKYHWGTHLFFSGLSNLLHIHPVDTFSLLYPFYILPLSLKYIYIFSNRISSLFLFKEINPLLVISLFLIYYFNISLMHFLIWLSESVLFGIVITLMYLSILLRYSTLINSKFFLLFSFVICIVITTIKGPIGIILLGVLSWLMIRTYLFSKERRRWLFVLPLIIIGVYSFINMYLLQDAHLGTSQNSIKNFFNLIGVLFFRKLEDQVLLNSTLLTIVIIFLLKYKHLIFSKKSMLLPSRFSLLLECIIITYILGLLLGSYIYKAGNHGAHYYFILPYVFLSIITIIVFLIGQIYQINVPFDKGRIVLMFLTIVIFIFLPKGLAFQKNLTTLKLHISRPQSPVNKYQELVAQLRTLSAIKDKHKNIIYIPEISKKRINSYMFMTQAFSGIALVGGTSRAIINYSGSQYKNLTIPSSLEDAKRFAKEHNYTNLIYCYQDEEGDFLLEKFRL